jgi:hypothetical protein
MPRFFIEVPHEEDKLACAKAIHVFQQSGSHLLTNAEWGCRDGDHCALLMVEADSRADVLGIIPPAYRADSRVVELRRFTPEYIQKIIDEHEG